MAYFYKTLLLQPQFSKYKYKYYAENSLPLLKYPHISFIYQTLKSYKIYSNLFELLTVAFCPLFSATKLQFNVHVLCNFSK